MNTAGGSASFNSLLRRISVTSVEPAFHGAEGNVALKARLGLNRIYRLTLPAGVDLEAALQELAAYPGVEYAEPDFIGFGAGIPDDPYWADQWGLSNTGQNGGKADADVDAPEAWNLGTGITNTVIAVIDTGIDLDHPDLAGKLVPGYDYVNLDNMPQDDHGHGTHVAGIAAATTGNGVGIAGMCPNCRIMPLKGLNSANWGYYSGWIAALEYAVDHGASVVNMSLGGTDNSQTLRNAVRYAYAANVPVVAAMMNDGQNMVYYPAAFPEVIAVGATDNQDRRASFSNFGEAIDLVAPGVGIQSTLWDNGYAAWDGTSMAAPHVAGTLGLLRSAYPQYTVEMLRTILQISADDRVGPAVEDAPGWDPYFGFGRLNAARALEYAQPPDQIDFQGPAQGWIYADLSWTVNVAPLTLLRPVTYTWYLSGAAPIVHTGGLSDTVAFRWPTEGVQTLTVVAANWIGAVTRTYTVTITRPAPGSELPVCAQGCPYHDLQSAVDAAGVDNLIKVAGGTYRGVNAYGGLSQVVYISKSLTLRGGYGPGATEPADPQLNPVVIDAQRQGRGITVIGPVSVTLEGVQITGGDAAGLQSNAGGGLYAEGAALTLRESRLISNTARLGGGLYLKNGSGWIAENWIRDNAADWGGGLYLDGGNPEVFANEVLFNGAGFDGGGAYLQRGAAVLLQNSFTENRAEQAGGGLYLNESGARMREDTYTGNQADQGGGIYLWRSPAQLMGNQLLGNQANQGGGAYLAESTPVLSNTLVTQNRAEAAGSGIYFRGGRAALLHTTLAANNQGQGSGLYLSNNSSVMLTNTIVARNTAGLFIEANNRITMEATLWGTGLWANGADWLGNGTLVSGSIQLRGDPLFADPEVNDYHLAAGSPALDAGIAAGVMEDFDGEARPQGAGYDLGADEYPAAPVLGIVGTVRADPFMVPAGGVVTLTLEVTNTGQGALHTSIQEILPEGMNTVGVLAWSDVVLTPGAVWRQAVVATVSSGIYGTLSNRLQVTSEEGITATAQSAVFAVEHGIILDPAAGGTLVVTRPGGGVLTITVPPAAVNEPLGLAYTALNSVSGIPAEMAWAGIAWRLDLYRRDGLVSLPLSRPMQLELAYQEAELLGVDEGMLELMNERSGTWDGEGISTLLRDGVENRLVVEGAALGAWALFGPAPVVPEYHIYLPLCVRLAQP